MLAPMSSLKVHNWIIDKSSNENIVSKALVDVMGLLIKKTSSTLENRVDK